MTPAQAIADLDRELAEHGQDVVLERVVANAREIRRPSRAFVRGYRADELSGGIIQGDSLVILSPSSMPAEFTDANRLRRSDRIFVSNRPKQVQYVDPVEVAGVIVRYNVQVRG